MKYKDYKLKTVFEMRYKLKNSSLGGKKITRNINGLNVTMHFKKGVCKITINNIVKINYMSQVDKNCREIDFKRAILDSEYAKLATEKLSGLLRKLEDEIRNQYYDVNIEVSEISKDVELCGIVTIK